MRVASAALVLVAALACRNGEAPRDTFAPPVGLSLASASGDSPEPVSRLWLDARGVSRDGAVVATTVELREALHLREVRTRVAVALGAPRDVLLYVDRETTFEVLSALLDALGGAGIRIDRVALAVATKGGKTGAIRLGPPLAPECELVFRGTDGARDSGAPKRDANAVPCTDEPGLRATVRVSPDGYAVTATGANLAPGCEAIGAGVAVAGRDLSALQRCLGRIKRLHLEFSTERAVAVKAAPATRFEELAQVLDAVRRDAEGGALFAEVTLVLSR